jgi:hypothetical protein
MTRPVRLRLSRARGFNLQAHSRAVNGLPAVNCARPWKWGNPFDFRKSSFGWLALSFDCRGDRRGRQEASVRAFREWIAQDGRRVKKIERRVVMVSGRKKIQVGSKMEAGPAPSIDEISAALRGKNLACWCGLDEPHCHVDTLLELANK